MDYTLDAFCTDCRSILTSGCPLPQALSDIAGKLARLLANPAFVAATFDVYVLAHVQEGAKQGKPHSHGASWAIYGNARAATDMTVWRRVNPEAEDDAVLEPLERHR